MEISVKKSKLSGSILIPASKSHTIRAIAIASAAEGTSTLKNPLVSADAISCVDTARMMGANVKTEADYTVEGYNNTPKAPNKVIDVGNSGTTLRLMTAFAALSDQAITFDGDNSIRQRPMQALLSALENLGVKVSSENGKVPLTVQGPIQGGETSVDGISSQFLSALLLACPLAKNDSLITVNNLHEKPYVEMTLHWLKSQGIKYESEGLNKFKVFGGQSYQAFNRSIPADFSSATFALCAAAITKSEILIKGLDFTDSQGDKEVFIHLEKMGVEIKHTPEGVIVKGGELKGIEIDLNNIPDALPALSVVACFAKGQTRLVNVAQARLKECDRIAAMATELNKMGGNVQELEDGMIINHSPLSGTNVHGHDDHRIVMALAIAGMAIEGTTTIDTAESVRITYPSFSKDMQALGANIE